MRRRFTPFGGIRELQDRMENLFKELEEEALESSKEPNRMFCDVAETDDEIAVTTDLPGVDKDDIDIRCSEDTLRISAKRQVEEEEEEAEGYVRRERAWGSYKRTMELPSNVDCDEVTASFQNGVLEVKLPKKETTKGKEIAIE